MTAAEIEFLKRLPCPVHGTLQRIIRALTTRQRAGGMMAPAPLVSRVYQELSNGLIAYNNAVKMKEVPVRQLRTNAAPPPAQSTPPHSDTRTIPTTTMCLRSLPSSTRALAAPPRRPHLLASKRRSALLPAAAVQVPFAYVQFNALLLILFSVLSPLAIA